ncbi:MAG: Ig-like domain-containing protein, partial [Thermoguttaceae bacterium]|nr:Ig-like domain-containing protein [Thermoguttaceae bacterium]
DSLSDEYAQEPYAYARNWVEILAAEGVNFGTSAAYGEPRREGFEYNWARAGATTESLLVQGQHLGVAGQAAAGQVNYAVLAIGQNDFAPGGAAYTGIYAQGIPGIGWTQTQIDAFAAGLVDNVRAALETLVRSGAHVVLANIADYGVAPLTQQLYPEAARRELVTEVIAAVNAQLVGLAAQFGVPLVDAFGLAQTYFGTNTAPVASQTVGGQVFWNQAGEDVQCAFVADGVHPHTVPQAILANLVLEALDAGYGVDVSPFWLDEAEIVGLVGLSYGGEDTLNLDYASYVVLPPANRPPTGVEDHYTTDEETLLSVPAASGVLANDSDPDGQTLLASLVRQAGHGTVTLDPEGSFRYQPEADFAGLDSFVYAVDDGVSAPVHVTVWVSVLPVNDAPAGRLDAYAVDEDGVLVVGPVDGVLANDADPDPGDLLEAMLVAGPSHGSLSLGRDGSFLYAPASDYFGPDSFTYQVSDGRLSSDPVTVYLSVNPVNDAPVAADDTYVLDQDGTLAVDVAHGLLANDHDLEGDSFRAVLDAPPQHGLLEFRADGSFGYTPDPGFFGTDHFTYRAVDADPSETAVVWLHVARSLGAIDYREINDVPVSTGPTWYRLQASHDGLLTAEAAVAGDPGDAQLEWYDAGRILLGVSSVRNGKQRLDQVASAQGVYYLRISGISDNLDLRLVNLVSQTGGAVTVRGTLENDPFEFDAAASRITIHGVAYDLAPSSFSTVEFDGRDGADSAVLLGTAARESAVLWPGPATLAGDGWTATVYSSENITIDGRGGGDQALFQASATLIDTFFAYPTHALMGAVGYLNRVMGFREVTAYGTPGGRDTAQFYGSPQADTFEAGPLAAWLTDGLSFANRAEGFRYVRALGDSEGFDTAVLRGTAGNESLTAQPRDVILSGSTLLLSAGGFEQVTVEGGGGTDVARFFGSDGADQFEARPGYAALQGVGFDNRASGFRYVAAYARGRGDRALLSGSPSFDSYVATATSDTLTGPGFSIVADGFDDVTAVGMGGGDLARLYGTPGDDVFEAHPAENWVRLAGGGVSHRAEEFRYVHVYPGDGGADQALLDDSSAADTFLAYPEYAVLSSANYSYRVNGFPSVAAASTRGGADLALLYDSEDDDTYEARVAWAVLAGPGFSNRAEGFPRIVASALRGGSDQARFDYTTADDTFFGNDQTSTILGGGYENTALGFRDVRVQGLLGEGWDRAYLFDSPGDDTLTASGNSATLAYPDHTIELLDLSWVRATSFRGGADKRRQEETIDFVLSTSGPWELF